MELRRLVVRGFPAVVAQRSISTTAQPPQRLRSAAPQKLWILLRLRLSRTRETRERQREPAGELIRADLFSSSRLVPAPARHPASLQLRWRRIESRRNESRKQERGGRPVIYVAARRTDAARKPPPRIRAGVERGALPLLRHAAPPLQGPATTIEEVLGRYTPVIGSGAVEETDEAR
jgi:hypothetical protein